MYKVYYLSIITLSLIFFSQNVLWAESASVVMKAEKINYSNESKQIEAEGAVEIKYKNIHISADKVLLDQDLKMVLAFGDVTVVKEGDSYSGERFLYDLKSQQGWLAPMSTEVTDPEINGITFLNAEEVFYKGEDLFLGNSYFTSCDLEQPHYHLTAKEMEYYPEDRIIFRKVWYWEGKYRLIYLPYFIISLKDYENGFEMPQIGRNASVGWFLYWGYNYYINNYNYGRILFDITEYGGDGIGVQHYINNSPTSRWYQKYYYLDNSDNPKPLNEYMFSYGYEDWSNPNLKWDGSFENWYKVNDQGSRYTKTTFNFNLNGITPYPRMSLRYQTDEWLDREIDLGGQWDYSKNNWSFNTYGRWLYSSYVNNEYPSEQIQYQINLRKNWEASYATLKISDRKALKGDLYSINYLPELTYVIPKWEWPILGDIYFSSQYTNLEKISNHDEQIIMEERGTRLGLDFKKTIDLGSIGDFSYNLDSTYRYRYFLIEDIYSDIAALTEAFRATYRFTEKFYTDASIGLTALKGIPNTFFQSDDYILPGAFINNGWYWHGPSFNSSLTLGYNFHNHYVQPIYFTSVWTPASSKRVEFNTTYDWELGLGQTNFRINYNPKANWNLGLYTGYNFQSKWWTEQQFQAFIIQPVTEKLRAEFRFRYDIFRDDFSEAKMGLVFDWHCREVAVNYDRLERKYWLQLNFKAFPQATIGLSSDPSEFMSQWIESY